MNNQSPAPARRSYVGPLILILIGVVFLLRNMGMNLPLFRWLAEYWPVILILWGLTRLVDYYQSSKEGSAPPRMGAGGVFLLIMIVLLGLTATQVVRFNWDAVRDEIDMDDDFMGFFGNRYEFQDELQQDFPAGASLQVSSDRGDIRVLPGDEGKLRVLVRKSVRTNSQGEADRINESLRPNIITAGNNVTLNANQRSGTMDLEIYVPRTAGLNLMTLRGDIAVLDRASDVKAHTSRGNVSLSDIQGSATVHMRHGSLRAERVSHDLSLEGRGDDTTLTHIGGSVRLNGSFYGTLSASKIAKSLSFQSSRTDLQMGGIEGDLTFDTGDFRARSVSGPLKLKTRSKDIHLEDIAGDIDVENMNGEVAVHVTKDLQGNIQVNNRRGAIQVWLPSAASFQMDARAEHSEVESDFSELSRSESGREARLTGTVGSGGRTIRLVSDRGRVEVHKSH